MKSRDDTDMALDEDGARNSTYCVGVCLCSCSVDAQN